MVTVSRRSRSPHLNSSCLSVSVKSNRELAQHTISLASVGSSRPPPPRPVRALNMPGHVKQTRETMMSWNLGDAYQGIVKDPILRSRYIQPAGRSGTMAGSETAEGSAAWLSVMVLRVSFVSKVSLVSDMVTARCRRWREDEVVAGSCGCIKTSDGGGGGGWGWELSFFASA